MKKLSLGIYLNVGIILMLTTASTFLILYVNNIQREHALVEAEEKSKIILNRNLATHTYFSKNLKPKLFELSDSLNNKNYFEPSWMSSTYAVREIDTYFKALDDDNYYYKECAVNARSPENEADEFEKAFIEELNANPDLEYRSLVRNLDDGFYFVTLRRGEVLEDNCMRCHSTPGNAPKELVDIYGPDRSFNRTSGDVVSAISIRVPISKSYARAEKVSKNLSFVFIIILSVIFLIQYFINKFLVNHPIEKMKQKALQIVKDDQHLGEELAIPNTLELSELADAFNTMSKKLRSHLDLLEKKVQDRTVELSEANDQLNAKMKELITTTKEKISLENRLNHAKKMESLGTMASGIAHNFNNILGAILGYSDLLKDEIPKDSTGYKYSEKILFSAHRAKDLVKQIMTFSKHKESSSALIQPDVVLDQALASIKDLIPANIRINKNISSVLGKIQIESFQFIKIITNITMNSIDAIHDKEGVLGITLEETVLKEDDILGQLGIQPGNFIKLSIRDTGQGILPENIDLVFDPFFSTKDVGKVSGIGLSVVHGIVRKNGGFTKVNSEQGIGSEFQVFFPVAEIPQNQSIQ